MVWRICCRLGVAVVFMGHRDNEIANVQAASTRQRRAPSEACPDTDLVRNLALGHWYSAWGKMQCDNVFQEETLSVVVTDVASQPGQCDVTFFRPFGDLRVRIVATESKVIDEHMRPPELRNRLKWYDVDRRICRLTSAVGGSPWIEAIPKDIVMFAFKSLNAIRQRFELVQRSCGGSLSLVSSEGLNGHVEPLEKTVARSFYLEVLESGTTVIPVHVRVQEYIHVDPATNASKTAYRFLSSNPSACHISASMPFSSFGCSATSIGPNGGAPFRRLSANLSSLEGSVEDHSRESSEMKAAQRHLDILLTEDHVPAYDMRQYFPRCVLLAKAIGLCSAAWAFAAVGAFEKQLCRLTDGRVVQSLSRQRILDCAGSNGGCHGGSVFDAHAIMLYANSLVTDSCAPYTTGSLISNQEGDAQEFSSNGKHISSCLSIGDDCVQRFATRLPSPSEMGYQTLLSNAVAGSAATNLIIGEGAMQAAILMYGAIVASFALYSDFLFYREGVYECGSLDEHRRIGTHSVQLLGWGIGMASAAKDKRYWIAENSWGPAWGENQFFRQCSVVDCRGPLCPSKDNSNPDCTDSPLWKDEFGNGCEWYVKNDLDCLMLPDSGQMTQCRNACRNCLPPRQKNGEMCGYFRMLRGSNHLGIEGSAMHTYIAGHSLSESEWSYLEKTCIDDTTWIDDFGLSCSWYRLHDPGCTKFQDIGQRAFCRKSCRSCPIDIVQVRAPSSVAEDIRSCGLQECFTSFVFVFIGHILVAV